MTRLLDKTLMGFSRIFGDDDRLSG